ACKQPGRGRAKKSSHLHDPLSVRGGPRCAHGANDVPAGTVRTWFPQAVHAILRSVGEHDGQMPVGEERSAKEFAASENRLTDDRARYEIRFGWSGEGKVRTNVLPQRLARVEFAINRSSGIHLDIRL